MNKRWQIEDRRWKLGLWLCFSALILQPSTFSQTYFDSDYTAAEVEALLDKVDALATVSQAEAEAGVATTDRLWTAERVAQAVAALSSATLGGLTDTTITALGDGELLVSSGGNWINQTLAEAGITTDLVSDLTPQLGGPLDVNGQEIQSAGDVVFQLGDNAGANKLSIQDSDSAEVASVDSDGVFGLNQINSSSGNLTISDSNLNNWVFHRANRWLEQNYNNGAQILWRLAGNSSAGSSLTFNNDTTLIRDAANTLALRNGANTQKFHIYSSYTDASNYERGLVGWDSGMFEIGSEAAGTGATRHTRLSSANRIYFNIQGGDDWSFQTDSTFRPETSNAFDIGGVSNKVRDLYLGTTANIDQGTVTDPTPALDLTTTWNDALDTMALIQANVTDTASAADSLLMDLQVGGTSKFKIAPDGSFYSSLNSPDTSAVYTFQGNTPYIRVKQSTGKYSSLSPVNFGFYDVGATNPALIEYGGLDLLENRRGVNPVEQRWFNTYTDASNGEWLELGFQDTTNTAVIKTNANGTGTVRNLEVYAGSAKAFTFTSTGTFSIDKNLLPSGSNNKDLGNPVAPWRSLYLGTTANIDQGTVTDPTAAIDITSTWNDALDTMALIQANVTDTASASDSLLMDLQVGGSPVFQVDKAGNVLGPDGSSVNPAYGFQSNPNTGWYLNSNTLRATVGGSPGFYITNSYAGMNTDSGGFFLGTSADVQLRRDAAGILAQRRSTNAQESRIYNTRTDASNGEWLELGFQDTTNTAVIKTNANGTGTVRGLQIGASGGPTMNFYAGTAQVQLATNQFFSSIGFNVAYGQTIRFSDGVDYSRAIAVDTTTNGLRASDNSSGFKAFRASYFGAIDQSADPSNPANGSHVLWQSDGTGSGDDGDIMLKITDSGGTTKTITLVDFSAF